jgi:hypothetical protein
MLRVIIWTSIALVFSLAMAGGSILTSQAFIEKNSKYLKKKKKNLM